MKIYNTKRVAEELNLPRLEVIRRIRLGDIEAEKFGWVWAIKPEAVDKVKQTDWYKKYTARQRRRNGD